MAVIRGYEHLGDLRMLDLIAKTSKSSIRDVIRVLIASRMVEKHFGLSLDVIVPEDYVFSGARPSPENVAACEQAHQELGEYEAKAMAALRTYK